MKVPFVDLQAQYTAIKNEIDQAVAHVVGKAAFIGGPCVSQFEEDFVVRVKNREAVMKELKNRGIETGIHYPIALPNLMAYRYLGYRPEDFPVAAEYSKEILSLPMFPEISKEQLQYVCNQVRDVIGG